MKQALIACLLMALVGCQTIGPKAAGRATGTAVYLGYAKIAEQKDDAFRAKVNALWTEVN